MGLALAFHLFQALQNFSDLGIVAYDEDLVAGIRLARRERVARARVSSSSCPSALDRVQSA